MLHIVYIYLLGILSLNYVQETNSNAMVNNSQDESIKDNISQKDTISNKPRHDNDIISDDIDIKIQTDYKNSKIIIVPNNKHVEEIFDLYNQPNHRFDYSRFLEYTISKAQKYQNSEHIVSAILESGYRNKDIQRNYCANKNLATIIDIDYNDIGFDDKNHSDKQSDKAHKLQQTNIDILAAMLTKIRKNNIIVIWLSSQPHDKATNIITKIRPLGLLDEQDLLSLQQNKERKQVQRQYIANQYCVVSILGNSRSDFDEAFEYLRNPNQFIGLEGMLENGWFLGPVPNLID